MNLKLWLLETRPQFLILSIVLVFLGTSVAAHDGFFDAVRFLLTLFGLTLLHISVNVLNDYYDYKSGIDLETQRTPFSGGSGILASGLLKPESVHRFGLLCLGLGIAIGIYLTFLSGWMLLPLVILAFISVYFYTNFFARLMLGEVFAGLGLGALPVLGVYFVQAGEYGLSAFVASVPPFILTYNLLFLNEFPDVHADRKGGRRNVVLALGNERAAKLYSALVLLCYGWILFSISMGLLPLACSVSFITLPKAFKAIRLAMAHHSDLGILPGLASNVLLALAIPTLLGLGFLLDILL